MLWQLLISFSYSFSAVSGKHLLLETSVSKPAPPQMSATNCSKPLSHIPFS